MSSLDGGFSVPSSINVGDPFVEPGKRSGAVLSRHTSKKKNVQTNPPKRGQTARSIGSGPCDFVASRNAYITRHQIDTAARKETRAKWRTGSFKQSSPGKRLETPGGNVGTFSGSIEHVDEGMYPKRGPREKIGREIKGPRNVQTAPSRGPATYRTDIGYPEYAPEPSTEDALKKIAKEERIGHTAAMKGKTNRTAFLSTHTGKGYFDCQEHTTAMKMHSLDDKAQANLRPPAERDVVVPREFVRGVLNKEPWRTSEKKDWRPSSPTKDGVNQEFVPLEYSVGASADDKAIRSALESTRNLPWKGRDLPDKIKARFSFKPSSGPKSFLTPSVALMGLRAK